MNSRRILIFIGAVILIIGSRLPWISVPVLFGVEGPAYEAIEIGWEDNGFVTSSIGLILIYVELFLGQKRTVMLSISRVVLGALAVMVVAGCVWRLFEINPSAGYIAATDVGLYVSLIGGLLIISAALHYFAVSLNT